MPIRFVLGAAVGLFGVVGLTGIGNATDYPIPAKIILIKFGGSPPVGKVAKIVSNGTFTLPTPPDDPETLGGSLTFDVGALGQITCDLSAGAFNGTEGWRSLGKPAGSKGYRYTNKNVSSGNPCKIVLLKEKVIKAVVLGTQSLAAPISPGFNPDIRVVLGAGSDLYCAHALAPHFKEKLATVIKAKDQVPPPDCTVPTTTTTTSTTTTTTTTTTSTTTTTLPEPVCGNDVVEPFEECEADEDCLPSEGCLSCECREKLGARVFSSTPTATGSGFFSSSFAGDALPLGGVEGTMTFEGGVQDDQGMASITTSGGPFYLAVDILAGAFGRFCMRIESCDGFVDCDGDTNVDVETVLDSLADGLTCVPPEPPDSCDPESTCCTNACEGFIDGTDPPVPVTSGNSPVVTTGVNPSDSGAGAVLLTCAVRQVDISPAEAAAQIDQGIDVMTACLAADYSGDTFAQVFTTGTNGGTVINECLSPLGSAGIEMSGANFDCSAWTTENGSGSLVFVAVAEEPRAITAGDNANAGVVTDGP